MNYTGLPKDMEVFSISWDYAIKGFISADLFVLDGEQLEVAGVSNLGDALAEDVMFNFVWNVSKR